MSNFRVEVGDFFIGCRIVCDLSDVTEENALNLAIEKWEFILAQHKNGVPEISGVGSYSCALCRLYNYGPFYCDGCPIACKTGRIFCDNTPYSNYLKAETLEGRIKYAEEEIVFLKGLKDDQKIND